jgi:hypothetical protein
MNRSTRRILTVFALLAAAGILAFRARTRTPAVARALPALAQGVIHYWDFETLDGSHIDRVGELTMEEQGGRMVREKGVVGEAVHIPLTRAWICSRSNIKVTLAPEEMTIAGWIRLDAGSNSPSPVFSNGDHANPRSKPWILQVEQNRLVFQGGESKVTSKSEVPRECWVHVATALTGVEGTSQQVSVQLYIDGEAAGTGDVTITPREDILLIGATHRGGTRMGGMIDELAIWDRALTSAEIMSLYQMGQKKIAIGSVVKQQQEVSITAKQDSQGAEGGEFTIRRNNSKGSLSVVVQTSGLADVSVDYEALPRTFTFTDGQSEIRVPVSRIERAPHYARYDDVKLTLVPKLHYSISETESSARVWLNKEVPKQVPNRPRKIFAHYMGCYPAGAGATAHHRIVDEHKMRHDGKDTPPFPSSGGRWRNWPLVPDNMRVSLEESADLEIRRAVRGGLDGFAVDAWAGGQGARDVFSALLKVAKEKDYPFGVTVCLDPAVSGNNDMLGTLRWIKEEHGDNPKLARRDGKMLIFGYLSGMVGAQHGAIKRSREDEQAKQYKSVYNERRDLWNSFYGDPALRWTKAGWKIMAEAQNKMAEALGDEIFFHYGMGGQFVGAGPWPGKNSAEELIRAAAFMAQHYDAVGQFKAGPSDEMADAVRASGAEWSQPLFYQYENLHYPGNDALADGTHHLRTQWEAARRNQSTLIQFVTWNDYTENTHLAPAYQTRYAVLDLNRYFIDWWKQGKEPKPEKDKIYLFYRKYPAESKIYPFKRLQKDPEGVIEVLTILTKPGKIRLVGRGEAWDAPAGMSWRHFPVTPGPVWVELLRRTWYGRQQVVLNLESPDPITDRPFRQLKSQAAISTEFENHWKADFGDALMVRRGEYGDDDDDGLPNWFEMYWFGKYMDYSTATAARPDDDSDGDGKTNLQEYNKQTDPTLEEGRRE